MRLEMCCPGSQDEQEYNLHLLSKFSFFSSTAFLGFMISSKDMTLGNGQNYANKWNTLSLIVIYLSKYSFECCYYASKCVIVLLLSTLALLEGRL